MFNPPIIKTVETEEGFRYSYNGIVVSKKDTVPMIGPEGNYYVVIAEAMKAGTLEVLLREVSAKGPRWVLVLKHVIDVMRSL